MVGSASVAAGNILWSKILGYQNGDKALTDVIELNDGSLVMTGSNRPANNSQVFSVKANSNGDTIWSSCFGGSFSIQGKGIVEMSIGNLFVAGQINYNSQEAKLYFMSLTPDGEVLWSKIIGDSASNYYIFSGNSIIKNNLSNTIALTGFRRSTNFDSNNVFIMSLGDTGGVNWERNFRNSFLDTRGWAINQCNDSGYIVAGDGQSRGLTDSDPQYLYVLKVDKNGNFQEPIGIQYQNTLIAEKYEVFANYPNPFNPTTKLRYHMAKDGLVNITIFNSAGQTLFFGEFYKKRGINEFEFRNDNLASGVYYFRFAFKKDCILTVKGIFLK